MKMQDYYGAVSRCDRCTNWDPARPMSCDNCFCRGFVADCLNCNGSGQISEVVAGTATLQDKSAAMMKSTCNICGGKRHFACNKPADWHITHPEPVEVAAEPVPEGEPKLGAAVATAYETAAAALKADPAGWVQPPLRPTSSAAV